MITGAENLLGSILAGAVGDALGAPVEFYTIDTIRRMYGPNGTTGYEEEYGGTGTITDDTQMTLFTMEGMIRFNVAVRTGQAPDRLRIPSSTPTSAGSTRRAPPGRAPGDASTSQHPTDG